MSTDRDLNRIVRSWMDEGVTALPDRVLDAVLDQLPATPQRRSVWTARRLFLMNNNIVRYGLAAAAVILVVIVGINLIGPNVGGPPEATPTPSAAEPSAAEPSASATPQALPMEFGRVLSAGTYSLLDFPVGVTFTVSEEWSACSESPVEQAVCYFPTGEFAGQLAFLVVTNVAINPCSPGEQFPDPPIGPLVDDLVTAITELEGYEVTAPVATTVDGYGGQQLTVTAPTDTGCEGFAPWATEDRNTAMGPGESNVLHIIDVDGLRVMIAIATDPASPSAFAFDEVLDSVQIQP